MQRHVLDELAEIAERIAREHVVVVRDAVRIVRELYLRDDHDLGQREGHSLTQLVRSTHGVCEP